MHKIISIVGPTATGKTALALQKAQEWLELGQVKGVNLISADSRQVFRGLEVVTGADIPAGFEVVSETKLKTKGMAGLSYRPIYKDSSRQIFLHGVKMIDVGSDWSLAHFVRFAREIAYWSIKNNYAVIMVGGTGLYHQHLWRHLNLAGHSKLPQKTAIFVGPNLEVRKQAETMALSGLQSWLKQIDEKRFLQMNQSDRQNPRRLVRAIEIALTTPVTSELVDKSQPGRTEVDQPPVTNRKPVRVGQEKPDKLHLIEPIGTGDIDFEVIKLLPASLDDLKPKITARVKARLQAGAVNEVKALLEQKLDPKSQVMTTLGVPEISQFLAGVISEEELIHLWTLHELQYAKRQITWFKRPDRAHQLQKNIGITPNHKVSPELLQPASKDDWF